VTYPTHPKPTRREQRVRPRMPGGAAASPLMQAGKSDCTRNGYQLGLVSTPI
jgi:hypothetical protein